MGPYSAAGATSTAEARWAGMQRTSARNRGIMGIGHDGRGGVQGLLLGDPAREAAVEDRDCGVTECLREWCDVSLRDSIEGSATNLEGEGSTRGGEDAVTVVDDDVSVPGDAQAGACVREALLHPITALSVPCTHAHKQSLNAHPRRQHVAQPSVVLGRDDVGVKERRARDALALKLVPATTGGFEVRHEPGRIEDLGLRVALAEERRELVGAEEADLGHGARLGHDRDGAREWAQRSTEKHCDGGVWGTAVRDRAHVLSISEFACGAWAQATVGTLHAYGRPEPPAWISNLEAATYFCKSTTLRFSFHQSNST